MSGYIFKNRYSDPHFFLGYLGQFLAYCDFFPQLQVWQKLCFPYKFDHFVNLNLVWMLSAESTVVSKRQYIFLTISTYYS